MLSRILGGIVIVFCVAGSSIAQSASRASPKIRVLIIDGASNHNWQLNTQLLVGLLKPTGLFDVSVSTCPRDSAGVV